MDIRIEKSFLTQGLYLAQGIADRRAAIPILGNVLLRAEKGKLFIAATDLGMLVFAELPCDVQQEGGLTVSAKQFYEIIKNLPNGQVQLSVTEENYLQVSTGKIRYKMVGLPVGDYPKLPTIEQVNFGNVETLALKELIGKTIFSVSVDENRPNLSGAFLESLPVEKPTLRMVSTDGHRLSRCTKEIGEKITIKPGIIIPRKALVEIRRFLETSSEKIGMGIYQGHLFLKDKSTVFGCKLNEATFPPYEQVIPKESTRVALVSSGLLLDALKRITLVAPDKTAGVKLYFVTGLLRIEANNPELGQGVEEIEIDYKGKELAIGFNAKYLIEIISEIGSGDVRFELNGELDPGMIRPNNESNQYVGVVMPMRI